jgi:anti-sigma B factor antagonist
VGEQVDFAVAIDTSDDCVVAHVAGDLDLASAGRLEDALAEAPPAPHVVIDLSDCTFVDSTGIRAISAAAREAPRLSIVTADPGILRTLEITALDRIVAVHASLDAAR